MTAIGFPWRELWLWLTAKRLSWIDFAIICVLGQVVKTLYDLGWPRR